MVRRTLAAIAATLALTGTAASVQAQPRQTIYVQNLATVGELSNTKFRDALPAFQAALDRDFTPIWHTPAKIVFLGHKAAPKGATVIQLMDYPDCFFCAGFHDYKDGTVFAHVGVDASMGSWQITFTHELWEMLVDPYVDADNLTARAVTLTDGTQYLVETADPVEAAKFAYTRLGRKGRRVWISDFVTQAWFDAQSTGDWDFTHSVRAPLEILKGGYQILRRPSDTDWTTINNFHQVVSDDDE